MTPAEKADLDQKAAQMVEMLPAVWYGLYRGCVSEGFTEQQAMQCVLTFISKQG